MNKNLIAVFVLVVSVSFFLKPLDFDTADRVPEKGRVVLVNARKHFYRRLMGI